MQQKAIVLRTGQGESTEKMPVSCIMGNIGPSSSGIYTILN